MPSCCKSATAAANVSARDRPPIVVFHVINRALRLRPVGSGAATEILDRLGYRVAPAAGHGEHGRQQIACAAGIQQLPFGSPAVPAMKTVDRGIRGSVLRHAHVLIVAHAEQIRILEHHQLPKIRQRIQRADRRQMFRKLLAADFSLETDGIGEIARIHDVIDLIGQTPVVDGLQHRTEQPIAKLLNFDLLEAAVPIDVEQIVRRNLPQADEFVGHCLRSPTGRIHDHQDIFRTAAGENGRIRTAGHDADGHRHDCTPRQVSQQRRPRPVVHRVFRFFEPWIGQPRR